jgi:hypothetical protein
MSSAHKRLKVGGFLIAVVLKVREIAEEPLHFKSRNLDNIGGRSTRQYLRISLSLSRQAFTEAEPTLRRRDLWADI